jgi:hypothetical protein
MARVYEKICPCKDCKERKVGCHATCMAYKEWQKNSIEIKEEFIDWAKRRRK